MTTPAEGFPVRVRLGQRPDHVRWFREVPRAGDWVNFAPPGMPRDDYEVDWVLHWAVDPDEDDTPRITIELQLIEPE